MDHSPRPDDSDQSPGYETRDLALKPIVYFVVGMILFGALVQVVMTNVMTGFYLPQTNMASPPKFADVMRDTNTPGDPKLQRDTTKDMLDMYAQEDAVLTSYAVDKKVGTNRIPLNRAVAIVAKKGLPVRPNPPERPPGLAYPARTDVYMATP